MAVSFASIRLLNFLIATFKVMRLMMLEVEFIQGITLVLNFTILLS